MLKRFRITVTAAVLAMPLVVTGSEVSPSEPLLRAAYVFNFLRFAEWPATKQTELMLCISSGNPPLSVAMEGLEGRTIRDLRIRVVRWKSDTKCDAIYVDTPNDKAALTDQGVLPEILTIGGYAGFVEEGGVLALVIEDQRLRFDVHLGTLRISRLKLSPQLLQLARRTLK